VGNSEFKLIVRDRIILLLKDRPLTTLNIQEAIPSKNARILGATISNNKNIFLRLDRGLVGLKNRDEHLVSGNRIQNDKFALYKKIFNVLINRECTLEEIYRHLPAEKKVSIRASITLKPDMFIRLAPGVIGRRGRDESLRKKYTNKKDFKSNYVKKTIADKVEALLKKKPHTFIEICSKLKTQHKKSISAKLSLHAKFIRLSNGYWNLKG